MKNSRSVVDLLFLCEAIDSCIALTYTVYIEAIQYKAVNVCRYQSATRRVARSMSKL